MLEAFQCLEDNGSIGGNSIVIINIAILHFPADTPAFGCLFTRAHVQSPCERKNSQCSILQAFLYDSHISFHCVDILLSLRIKMDIVSLRII